MNKNHLYYPNAWARNYFNSFLPDVSPDYMIWKLLGLAGFVHLGWENFPPDNMERVIEFAAIAGFTQSVREMYGKKGGNVMIRRASRRWFPTFAPLLENKVGQERSMPQVLSALADLFTELSDQETVFQPPNLVIVKRCPFCVQRQHDTPMCDPLLWLIQAALAWANTDAAFKVSETSCCAKGDSTCTFSVESI